MSIFSHVFHCVAHTGIGKEPPRKVKFGLPLEQTFSSKSEKRRQASSALLSRDTKPKPGDNAAHQLSRLPSEPFFLNISLPLPLWELLTHLATTAIRCKDLFRRPGNVQHVQNIIQSMRHGTRVCWVEYSGYTLANVVKRFLLDMPGGLFGVKTEEELMQCVVLGAAIPCRVQEDRCLELFQSILRKLPLAGWQLVVLIFGIWFRMIILSRFNCNDYPSVEEKDVVCYDVDIHNVAAEAVAKSVCGSVFHTCRDSPARVEVASQVLKVLILSFPSWDEKAAEFYRYATERQTAPSECFPQKRGSLLRRFSLLTNHLRSHKWNRASHDPHISPENVPHRDARQQCEESVTDVVSSCNSISLKPTSPTETSIPVLIVTSDGTTLPGDSQLMPDSGSLSIPCTSVIADVHQHQSSCGILAGSSLATPRDQTKGDIQSSSSSTAVLRRHADMLRMRSEWFLSTPYPRSTPSCDPIHLNISSAMSAASFQSENCQHFSINNQEFSEMGFTSNNKVQPHLLSVANHREDPIIIGGSRGGSATFLEDFGISEGECQPRKANSSMGLGEDVTWPDDRD